MNAEFQIKSIYSVLPTYSWDLGVPTTSAVSLTSICAECECLGKHDLKWKWNERDSAETEQTTWLTTASGSQYEKVWIECSGKYGLRWSWEQRDSGCFQKHDMAWKWANLEQSVATWENTKPNEQYEKKWKFEPGSNENELTTWTSTATGAPWEKQWKELPVYTGYAPHVNISINSSTSNSNIAFSAAAIRSVDFGDSYNSENNIVTTEGYNPAVFCHTYVMPGTYLVKFNQTEYVTVNNFRKQKCLGKHERNWKWNLYKSDCFQKHYLFWNWNALQNPTLSGTYATWQSSAEYQDLQKKWKFEPTEEQLTWFKTATNQSLNKKWKEELSVYDVITEKGLFYKQFGSDVLYEQDVNENSVLKDLTWQWQNIVQEGTHDLNREVTWEDVALLGKEQNTWDSISTPCIPFDSERGEIYWKWKSLTDIYYSGDPHNKTITWENTNKDHFFNQTWNYACEEVFPELSANSHSYAGEFLVNVIEIPPKAYISITENNNNVVCFTPKFTQCGSFPIDKIVWNFGDGSPLVTQRRWAPSDDYPFVHTNNLSSDYEDPRNYDVYHTYKRTKEDVDTITVSLTAYASSTGTADCHSTSLTGINFEEFDKTIHDVKLLQSHLNDDGSSIIIGQTGEHVCVWKLN